MTRAWCGVWIAGLDDLVAAVDGGDGEQVDRWLGGPEADAADSTNGYVAASALMTAAEQARLRPA